MRCAPLRVASRVIAVGVIATASGWAVTALPSVLGPRSHARVPGARVSLRTAPAHTPSTSPAPVVWSRAQTAASTGTRAVGFGRPHENRPNASAYEHVTHT